jgi:hypothetical protein
MDNTFDWIAMFLLIVSSIGLGYGVDLKKWHGWLYVSSGFLFGIMVGLSIESMISGLVTGTFVALLLLWLGPIMLRRRQN